MFTWPFSLQRMSKVVEESLIPAKRRGRVSLFALGHLNVACTALGRLEPACSCCAALYVSWILVGGKVRLAEFLHCCQPATLTE